MPKKQDKFGIKFWMLIDVDSKFMHNAFRYLGKDKSESKTGRPLENVVMHRLNP